jgi:hypothetical protein
VRRKPPFSGGIVAIQAKSGVDTSTVCTNAYVDILGKLM